MSSVSRVVSWGLIGSGEVFQSLINTLIAHKDPKARLTTRPGRDGAQDCLSGDGSIVYQAKFRSDRSPAKILLDAQKECDKIAKYQQSGDARSNLWQNKSRWILVTNAAFNANDRSKWDRDVVPRFSNIGLTAECWTSAEVESFLTDYPEVYRAYFEGETRLFLSLAEVRRVLIDSEVIVGSEDDFGAPFAGRDDAFNRFDQFLTADRRVLLVHGPGGVGKSRFIFEAACRAIDAGATADAYWGNLANLEASTAWYAGLVPERDALVLLDEPDDPALLRRILEELRGSLRTANWKVVVTVRTPKSPVISILRDPRNRLLAPEIELSPLSTGESTQLAQALADRFLPSVLTSDRDRLFDILRTASAAYPMWMTVATELLRSGQDLFTLPRDQFQLAERYLHEIVTKGLSPEEQCKTRNVLRWTALCQPVNSEDDRVTEFMATRSAMSTASLLEVLVKLSSRRAVRRSGLRKRVFAVSPDVLRDHALLTWLSFLDSDADPPVRRLSSGGEVLVQLLVEMIGGTKATPPYLERLIARVGHIEFMLQDQVDFLGPIASALEELAKVNTGALFRGALLARSTAVALFRPAAFARFIRFIRSNPAVPEPSINPLRPEANTQDDLILEMAWPMFNGGTTARESADRKVILDEMAALVHAEEAVRQSTGVLPNDGRRAGALLRRLITNDAELASSYHDEAYELGQRMIGDLRSEHALTAAELVVARASLEPQLELERTQTWSNRTSINIARIQLDADSEQFILRSKLLDELWAIVTSARGHTQNRECIWGLLARAQRDVNQGARRGQPFLVEEATRNLERALASVSRRGISLVEVQVARSVWNWNAQFDEDPRRSELAAKCEAVLAAHPDAIGLVELLASDVPTRNTKRDETVAQLTGADAEDLGRFFERCVRFVAASSEQWRLGLVRHIAFDVGRNGHTNPAVSDYACSLSSRDVALLEVRLGMLSGLIEALRPDSAAAVLARKALAAADGDAIRERVIFEIYGFSAPVLTTRLTSAEFDLIAELFETLLISNAPSTFRVIGRFISVDMDRVFSLAKSAWGKFSPDAREECFGSLVNGIHERMVFCKEHPVPFGAAEWEELLALMIDLPDIDGLGGNLFWTLNEMRRDLAPLPPRWLVLFLERRAMVLGTAFDLHMLGRAYRANIVPHQAELFEWVREVDPDDPDDCAAIDKVLTWVGREDQLGYSAPTVLTRLDGNGKLVPGLVESQLVAMSSGTKLEDIWNLARLGGHYVEGTAAWRKIAAPACKLARAEVEERNRFSIYGALKWHGPQGWSGRYGEFHPRWEQAVEEAKKKFEAETDQDIKEYFAWRLRVAEAELEREQGLFEEEHNR